MFAKSQSTARLVVDSCVCVSQDRVLLRATNLVEEFLYGRVLVVTSQEVRVLGSERADASGPVCM